MKKLLLTLSLFIIFTISVSALEGNTDYYFESEKPNEFFIRAEPIYNYNGLIPSSVHGLYDMSLPQIYTSDYGSNIILPSPTEETEEVLIAQNPLLTPKSQYFDMYGGLPVAVQQITTPVTFDLYRSDGSIGTLSIPAIGLSVKAYDGDELAAMRKGIGLINGTSGWNYNTGFVGHNRGTNAYFGKLKYLNAGDVITYATNAGTKNYQVTWAGQIDANDWSKLEYTGKNQITLITCVENVPSKRVCVVGVEF